MTGAGSQSLGGIVEGCYLPNVAYLIYTASPSVGVTVIYVH